MFRKLSLLLIHEKKICSNSCSKTYPWGWKSKDIILNYKSNLDKKKIITKNLNEIKTSFNEKKFLNDSIYAYNKIYTSYLKKKDFLDYEFTNPKLSIALNELRNNSNDDKILKLPEKISVKDSKILSNKIVNEITTNNFKFLGYYNFNEIVHQIVAGAVGPEVRYLWDQLPIKQKVNVLYKSENYFDIVEWERDLADEEPEWQVSNINKLIN